MSAPAEAGEATAETIDRSREAAVGTSRDTAHRRARPSAPGLQLPADGSTFGTFGDFNFVGLWTLYLKEVRRFLKVVLQTVLAPVVTTLIFLVVFSLALGRATTTIAGMPFLEFMAPGLVMMAIIQNAFANTSSSIMIAKVQGNIVDYLMPPLSPGELLFGVVMGGITRGIMVGLVVWLSMVFFVPMTPVHIWAVVYFMLTASLILSIIGLLGALWAEKFDQLATLTNFVITPLSFLSGTFYSIDRLPGVFHEIALLNPVFYMIDGLRYGITGHSDAGAWLGALVLAVTSVCLWIVAYRLLKSGYRVKS